MIKGNLYIIKNKVNDYVYIGKTYDTIANRFRGHIYAAYAKENNAFKVNDKFHQAIRNIGFDQFYIELIGTYDKGVLEDKEREYIKLYDSYYNGYNSTLGGDTGCQYEISKELEVDIIELYKQGYSAVDIAALYEVSYRIVRNILSSNIIDTNKSYKHSMEIKDHIVYGVHRKCGQIVQYKNEYEAAEDIIKANLSKQKAYYVKNDILRSINTDKYGVGGYIWFDDVNSAIKFSKSLDEKDRYEVIPIKSTRLVDVKLISTKREQMRSEVRAIRQEIKNETDIKINSILANVSNEYPPSKDNLALLILYMSVNSIATYYKVSFTSMKQRLKKYGLPYTKEDIIAYRNSKGIS